MNNKPSQEFVIGLRNHLEKLDHLGFSERRALKAAQNPDVPRHARALAGAEKEVRERAGVSGVVDWLKNFDWAKWLPAILSVIGLLLMFLGKEDGEGVGADESEGFLDGSFIANLIAGRATPYLRKRFPDFPSDDTGLQEFIKAQIMEMMSS